MLARLDMETRDQHAEVDGYWLDLMASAVTREQYKTLLMRIYGFEAPIECALAYTPHLVVADRRERTRSGLVVQDLLALGITPGKVTALPQCPAIASFADPAEALGWKYVIERPTQLHSAIASPPHAGSSLACCSTRSQSVPARPIAWSPPRRQHSPR
jgi:heme oxygenase (biliverdin-IX-beta and delta-forming)